MARKGDEHERRYLEDLRAAHGAELVEIETGPGNLVRAVRRTTEAMHAGASVIFRGTLSDEGWRGHADFG